MLWVYIALSALAFLNSTTEAVENGTFNKECCGDLVAKVAEVELGIEKLQTDLLALQASLDTKCHAKNTASSSNLVGIFTSYNAMESHIISSSGVCNKQSIPPLPVEVRGPSSVFYNDHLLVCGGMVWSEPESTSKPSSACYKLHSSSSSNWTAVAPMKIARSSFTLTKVRDDVFAVGGMSEYHTSIEKYSGDSWHVIPAKLPKPVYSHCTVYLKKTNSLVVIGGAREIYSLDLSTWEWSNLPDIPMENYELYQGYGCAALEQDDKETILVTGGWKMWDKSRPPSPCSGWVSDGEYLSQVYAYDGTAWSLSGELVGPRSYHSMAVLDGRPLVVGGGAKTPNECKHEKVFRLERMNEAGKWEKLPESLTIGSFGRALQTVAIVPANAFPCLDA